MDVVTSIREAFQRETPYKYSKAYYPLIGIGALLFVIGGVMGVYAFVKGHHATFGVTRDVPLGILLSTYIFFVVSSTGCCLISSLGHVFKVEDFEPISKRIVFLALATIFSGFLVLVFELEHPLKMVWNYLSPNLMSNIWWMGTLYILYIIFMALEFIALLSKQLRHAAIFGLFGVFFGIIAHSNLGGIFATLTARPYWHGPFIPVYFILSAFVSGGAIALFFTYVSHKLRGIDFDEKTKKSLGAVAKLQTVFLFVLLFFYWWEMIIGFFGFPHGKHEATMALLFGPLRFNFWFFEIFLGVVLPLGLLLTTKLRNVNAMFLASVSCLVGIYFMRYDLVVVDQLTPVWHAIGAKLYETYASYTPSVGEILIVVCGFGFCMVFYLLAERFLILDEVHDEETEELTEEEARVLALAEAVRAKRKGKIEGPWQLEAKMKPHEPKTLKLDRAKEILEESKEEK